MHVDHLPTLVPWNIEEHLYGEMFLAEGTDITYLTEADKWYPLVNGYFAGLLRGFTFDPVTDSLYAQYHCFCQVTCQISYTATANKHYEFGISINDATPSPKYHSSSMSRTSGTEISAPIVALIELFSEDKINLMVSSNTAGNQIVIVHFNLSLSSI